MTHSRLDLTRLIWTIEGWREWEWMLGPAIENGNPRTPDIGPVPTNVPGSVRGALLRAGIVPDPLIGTQSRASEFLEHRHWIYRTRLPQDFDRTPGARAELRFDSLDGRGEIHLAGRRVAEFNNTFVPTTATIPDDVTIACAELAVVFHSPPGDLGQVGWTSRRRDWKPRFNYGWDWTPRLVQTAIVGGAALVVEDGDSIESTEILTRFDHASGRGYVEARVRTRVASAGGSVVELSLLDAGQTVRAVSSPAATSLTLALDGLSVEAWDPLSEEPRRYIVQVRLVSDGVQGDQVDRTVGFREISWDATEGAPVDAEPWLCSVNGRQIFLQGVNWVPIRPDYADVADVEYRRRLQVYRWMGVNIVRVWGGATLERPVFYELCDELGLLVWQELPLSSSGIDNYPPDDQQFVNEFAEIAGSYVHRLGHHPCIAVWGGGNELAGRRGEMDIDAAPLTFAHPALAAARNAIQQHGIDAKVVPSSPSGPVFVVSPSTQESTGGRGLHHDVHGPWSFEGDDADWDYYWSADDAMLRSEVGIPGASGRDVLEHFGLWADGERPAVWDHSSAWWITDEYSSDASLATSQERQARRLAAAARASKERYPRCAGFIVWMGHDSFPCAVSLALLDVNGRPKPVVSMLAEVFRAELRTR